MCKKVMVPETLSRWLRSLFAAIDIVVIINSWQIIIPIVDIKNIWYSNSNSSYNKYFV